MKGVLSILHTYMLKQGKYEIVIYFQNYNNRLLAFKKKYWIFSSTRHLSIPANEEEEKKKKPVNKAFRHFNVFWFLKSEELKIDWINMALPYNTSTAVLHFISLLYFKKKKLV